MSTRPSPILDVAAQYPAEGPFTEVLKSGLVPGTQQGQEARPSGFMGTAGKLAMFGEKFLEGLQRGSVLKYISQEQQRSNAYRAAASEYNSVLQNPDSTREQVAAAQKGINDLNAGFFTSIAGDEKKTKKGKKKADQPGASGGASGDSSTSGQDQKEGIGHHIIGMAGSIFKGLAGPNIPHGAMPDMQHVKASLYDIQQMGDRPTLQKKAEAQIGAAIQDALAKNPYLDKSGISQLPKVQEGLASLAQLNGEQGAQQTFDRLAASIPDVGSEAWKTQQLNKAFPAAPPDARTAAPGQPPAPGQPAAPGEAALPAITGPQMSALGQFDPKAITKTQPVEWEDASGKKVGPVEGHWINVPNHGAGWYVEDGKGNFFAPDPTKVRPASLAEKQETVDEVHQKQEDALYKRQHGGTLTPEEKKLADQAESRLSYTAQAAGNAPASEQKLLENAFKTIEDAKKKGNYVPPSAEKAAQMIIDEHDIRKQQGLANLAKSTGTGNAAYDKILDQMLEEKDKKKAYDLLPSPSKVYVEQLLRGQLPITGNSLQRMGGQGSGTNPALALAVQAAGLLSGYTWSATDYDTMRKARMDFTGSGRSAETVNAISNGLGHLAVLYDSADKLPTDSKLVVPNNIFKLGWHANMSDPAVAKFKTDSLVVENDLIRAITGKAGTDQTNAEWRKRLDGTVNKEAYKEVLKDLVTKTLMVRLRTENGLWQNTFHRPAEDMVVRDNMKAVLDRFGVDYSDIRPNYFQKNAPGSSEFDIYENPPATPAGAATEAPANNDMEQYEMNIGGFKVGVGHKK